jgi:hypothetical protein
MTTGNLTCYALHRKETGAGTLSPHQHLVIFRSLQAGVGYRMQIHADDRLQSEGVPS